MLKFCSELEQIKQESFDYIMQKIMHLHYASRFHLDGHISQNYNNIWNFQVEFWKIIHLCMKLYFVQMTTLENYDTR